MFLFVFAFLVLAATNSLAESNQTHVDSNASITAKAAIDGAISDVNEMQGRGIPTSRANESLQEAIQLYNAQLALERTGGIADYSLVLADTKDVGDIKNIAIKASDELKIFDETYTKASQETNLSQMQQQYDDIQNSFKDERFEDTLTLIDKGYQSISDIQASQTAVKLFYDSTTNTLKKFFVDNWIKLSIILIIAVAALIISWTTIRKARIKSKINHLILEKATLNDLIKKMQYSYFKTMSLSETEYKVKTERFKEMIRDIDRQIPLLKEELVKLDKRELNARKKSDLEY